jgi:16S rRNA G966 N2-methylase RsmD
MKADKEFTENYAHGLVHLLRAGSRAAKIGVLDEKKFLRLTKDGLRESALALIEAGYSVRDVAAALDVPKSTVHDAVSESRTLDEEKDQELQDQASENRTEAGGRAATTRTAHEQIAKFAFDQPTREVPTGNPIRFDDFYEGSVELGDNSVDLIFTDPPYDDKSVPLFDQAGEVAARVLKPGGSLVTYCGNAQCIKAANALSSHLRFWQPLCCLHSGPFSRLTEYGVIARFKPMLWFVKGTRSDKHTFIENGVTGQREKDHHEWQQAEAEAAYFIEALSPKGGLVVDFFAGSGTTIVAAQRLGRNAIGYEIDPKHHAAACKRIAGINDIPSDLSIPAFMQRRPAP